MTKAFAFIDEPGIALALTFNVEIENGDNFRPATAAEIVEARLLNDSGDCEHNVFTDVDGWPYVHRLCSMCSKRLRII